MRNRFRWVECQLKTLRDQRTVKAVKIALCQLPESLDETYDRILNNIPKAYREQAHCVLQLLTVSSRALTIDELAEAVTVDCTKEQVDPELRLRDPYEILEICSSLVELSGYVFNPHMMESDMI
jgi:hypothetical protein